MIDLLETIFIWGLYLGLPVVLLTRFAGPRVAGVSLMAIFIFNSLVMDPSEILVNSSSINSDLNEIVLVKNTTISSRKNKKKFDFSFHRKLEKHFPDWDERMNYQKKQENFYKSARTKQAELKRIKAIDKKNRYTKEELDAIDYFQGTGFYARQQDPKMKPNIYDTRQSFLLKMHDDQMRDEFLASFNRKNQLKS